MTMPVRLALLAAVFCVGCDAALPEESARQTAAEKASLSKEKEIAGAKKDGEAKSAAAPEGKEPAEAEPAKGEEDEVKGHVTVRCVPAKMRALAVTVDSLGRTELLPDNLGSLTATVEGHVHKLLVNLGDSVKAGQPIVELDTTVARTALAEKIANRDSLTAALRFLESRPRPEETRRRS